MTWLDLLVGNCYADLPPQCYEGSASCTCSGFPLFLPIIVFGAFVVMCFRVNRNYNEISEQYFLTQQKNHEVKG